MRHGLRLKSDADARVLKCQLDVIAGVGRSAWVITPLWALALAWLGSASCGYFGHRNLAVTAIFPLIVCAVSFGAYRLYDTYRAEAEIDAENARRWVGRFIAIQLAISSAWGLLPWLTWDGGNLLNHIFILLAVATTVSSLMISRASDRVMLIAGMIPIAGLTALRFLVEGSWIDLGFALLTPLYALHLYSDGRRIIFRLEEDVRLRFNVEDLAAALTHTRDDAIAKRYEAETANAAKSAFLANMSHELRTPLNAILGFSEIIGDQAMGPKAVDRYSDYARDIHNSGAHLLSLINDLLDVAKIEAGKMEIEPKPVDVRYVVDSIGRIMGSRFAAKQQDFSIVLAPELPLLLADERALKQMLLNLVSNAAKFTPQGGHISITCGQTRRGGLQFCVDDNGPGISPEKLARVFQPFSQIDNRFDREAGGTGLGLALVQGLAQLHGGRAWIESELGLGVRAFLYFPSTIAAASRRESA